MHELALAESLVAAIEEQLGPVRVKAVHLEVGRMAAVMPEALRFCFGVCTEHTPFAGATLEITEVAARGCCRNCGLEAEFDTVVAICSCGSTDLQLVSGQELRVRGVEVM